MAKPIVVDRRILERLREQVVFGPRLDIRYFINRIFTLDCITLLRMLPDNSVDMIMTDEPWGITSSVITFSSRKAYTTEFKWDGDLPAHLVIPWVYESARVLKDGGALVNLGIASWSTTFEDVCNDAGLNFRCNDVWLKPNPPTRVRHGGFRSGHAMIWIATKGTAKDTMKRQRQQELLNWTIETCCPSCDVSFPVSYSKNYKVSDLDWAEGHEWASLTHFAPYKASAHRVGHQTEQPSWLPRRYIDMFTSKGDIVLDLFAGSGTFVIEAAKMNRKFIGCEKDAGWAESIKRRLKFQQGGLFE